MKGVTANLTLWNIFDACRIETRSEEKKLQVHVNDQKNQLINFTVEYYGYSGWNLTGVYLYHIDTLDVQFPFQKCGRFFIHNCFDTT